MNWFKRWNEGWKKVTYRTYHGKPVYYKDLDPYESAQRTRVDKVHLTGATRLYSKGACTTFGMRSHESPCEIQVEVEFLVEYYAPSRIFSDGGSVGNRETRYIWSIPAMAKFSHNNFLKHY